MPNGDCAVGARNAADIANMGREMSEVKGTLKEHERSIEANTIAIKHQGWQIGVIVGLILLFGGPLAEKLMALVLP